MPFCWRSNRTSAVLPIWLCAKARDISRAADDAILARSWRVALSTWFGMSAALVPLRGEYGNMCIRENAAARMNVIVCANSSSVSPGNPVMRSADIPQFLNRRRSSFIASFAARVSYLRPMRSSVSSHPLCSDR